jgi:hypothetical protein
VPEAFAVAVGGRSESEKPKLRYQIKTPFGEFPGPGAHGIEDVISGHTAAHFAEVALIAAVTLENRAEGLRDLLALHDFAQDGEGLRRRVHAADRPNVHERDGPKERAGAGSEVHPVTGRPGRGEGVEDVLGAHAQTELSVEEVGKVRAVIGEPVGVESRHVIGHVSPPWSVAERSSVIIRAAPGRQGAPE